MNDKTVIGILAVALVICGIVISGLISNLNSVKAEYKSNIQALIEEDRTNYQTGLNLYKSINDTCDYFDQAYNSETAIKCYSGILDTNNPGWNSGSTGDDIFKVNVADQTPTE